MREESRGEGFWWCWWGRRRRWELGRYRELLWGRRRWGRRGWRRGWRCRSRSRRWGLLQPSGWRQEVSWWAGEALLQRLLQTILENRLSGGSWHRGRWRGWWWRRRKCNSIGQWGRWRSRRWGYEGRWGRRSLQAQPEHSHSGPGSRHRGWRRRWWWRRDISPCCNVIDIGLGDLRWGLRGGHGEHRLAERFDVTRQPVVGLRGLLVLQPVDGAELVHGGGRRVIRHHLDRGWWRRGRRRWRWRWRGRRGRRRLLLGLLLGVVVTTGGLRLLLWRLRGQRGLQRHLWGRRRLLVLHLRLVGGQRLHRSLWGGCQGLVLH